MTAAGGTGGVRRGPSRAQDGEAVRSEANWGEDEGFDFGFAANDFGVAGPSLEGPFLPVA